MDSEPNRSATAVRTDPPPAYWGDHDAHPLERLEPGWVVTTWALCVLMALGLATLGTLFAMAVADTPITGETNTELGVLTIVAAMSTFVGFVVVLVARLVRVDHDRLVNSLAVAALHVLVAIALFAVELALQGLGMGVGDVFDGPWTDEIGNAFTVLERSSAAVILAALLSVGMVPARGDRPTGTQTGYQPQDRQL
jgi:hypothetical protein